MVGDLSDRASLPAAVDGVDGVFHVGPAFVFSGVIHPSISALTNHTSKLPVEEALYDSGMDFTVLQPARFMQNWAGAWPEVVEHGRLPMPYSVSARFCWVDYRDVAEVAALAMTTDRLSNGTFELSAPGMPDGEETAAIVSEVVGRHVRPREVSREEFAAQLPGGPLRDGLLRMLAHDDAHGLPGGNALVLRAILGREPRTLRQYFGELGDDVCSHRVAEDPVW